MLKYAGIIRKEYFLFFLAFFKVRPNDDSDNKPKHVTTPYYKKCRLKCPIIDFLNTHIWAINKYSTMMIKGDCRMEIKKL